MLTDLKYADDICLISKSIEDMGNMLQNLEEQAMKFGFDINVQKTVEMKTWKKT